MAQSKNNSNSEDICKKLYKKFTFSTTSHPKPQIQTGSDHSVSSHKNKNVSFFSPKKHSNRNEQRSSDNPYHDRKEVVIVNGHGNDKKAAKSASRQEYVSPRGHFGNEVLKETKPSKSLKDEGKFTDYIRKVKDRMRTVSNVGVRKSATKRDSFNDKVSHYINRAKIKIRTTTMVDNDKNVSSK